MSRSGQQQREQQVTMLDHSYGHRLYKMAKGGKNKELTLDMYSLHEMSFAIYANALKIYLFPKLFSQMSSMVRKVSEIQVSNFTIFTQVSDFPFRILRKFLVSNFRFSGAEFSIIIFDVHCFVFGCHNLPFVW